MKHETYLSLNFDASPFQLICLGWCQSGALPPGVGGSCSSCLVFGFFVPPCLLSGWTLLPLHLLHTGWLPGAQDVRRSGPAGQLQGIIYNLIIKDNTCTVRFFPKQHYCLLETSICAGHCKIWTKVYRHPGALCVDISWSDWKDDSYLCWILLNACSGERT